MIPPPVLATARQRQVVERPAETQRRERDVQVAVPLLPKPERSVVLLSPVNHSATPDGGLTHNAAAAPSTRQSRQATATTSPRSQRGCRIGEPALWPSHIGRIKASRRYR